GIDEDEAPVAGHDHAAAEELSRLIVEVQVMKRVAQGRAVVLLVEGDLDAPFIALAGGCVPLVHSGNSIAVPSGPRLITLVGPTSSCAPQDSWMCPQTASCGRLDSIVSRIASLPRWSPALDWSQWPFGGEWTTSTAPSGQPASFSRACCSSRSKLQSHGVTGIPAPSP